MAWANACQHMAAPAQVMTRALRTGTIRDAKAKPPIDRDFINRPA